MTDETRQLILLCDGTNNTATGGSNDTNVVKVLSQLSPHDSHQKVFYDAGVGKPDALPGATQSDKLKRHWERLSGLAFGSGVYENISDAYGFLVDNYRPGDQIFVFGFSRGAFTARALAGLVNMFGILAPEHGNMMPSLLHIYFSQRNARGSKDERKRLATIAQIRQLFVPVAHRETWVHFVGVWDTVASIGLPPFDRQITGSPTIKNADGTPKKFRHVRHVLALDEHRTPFQPRLYLQESLPEPNAHGQTLLQYWFPGAHCDAGGGYVDEGATLSDGALAWMVEEAIACGLRGVLPRPISVGAPARIHSELYDKPWWAIAGMSVRNPRVALDENERALPIRAERPVSVAPQALAFAADTVWSRRRSFWSFTGALLCAVLIYLAMGWALTDPSAMQASNAVHGTWLAAVIEANSTLARWQLTSLKSCPAITIPGAGGWPRTAVALDFAFIAAYAYVLSRLATRAFATLAGVRDIHSPARPVLNLLGGGLKLLVVADVVENLLTLLVFNFHTTWYPCLVHLLQLALALASTLKFSGLALVLFLVGWGMMARVKRHT
jgi:uncharacterized protein (DUF2235 family)